MLPSNTQSFLVHHLRAHDFYEMKDNEVVNNFISKYPPDILLMLRLYELELGNTLTGQIIEKLFIIFKKNYVSREDSIAIEVPYINFCFMFISSYFITKHFFFLLYLFF